MKKIKILMLLVLIILVSGCKIRSNITVSYDGSVVEKVRITEAKDGESIEYYSNYIDEEIIGYRTLINYGKYNYEKINNSTTYGVEFYKKYDNICSYFQDTLFNQYLYKHIHCEDGDAFIIIDNDTPFLEKYDDEDYSNPLDLSDVELSISLPVRAYEHNADRVEDNVYIWEFNEETIDKNINLKILKSDLDEAKINHKKSIEVKKQKDTLIIIAVIICIIVGIAFVAFTLYKKYQENKLDY